MDKLWQFLENSQNATAAAQQIVPGEGSGFHFQTNSTYEAINHLKFANAKSVRTSGIILASFNAVIATALALGIFWDCFVASRRAVSRFRSHSFLFKVIGPPDIFPFVLSIAIITQGVVFAVVQSKGLDGLLILGCQPLSQLMLPATFLVPYFQFSFAIETLIRALRPGQFPRMGAWAFAASVTVAVLGLFGTYAVSLVYKAPDFCFASLFFFVQRWAFQISIVFIVITVFLLVSTVVTYIRLKGTNIPPVERQAASRMVYFMGSGVLTNGLILPFFALLGLANSTDNQARFKLAMVAMVSANLTAIINAVIWIFLRTCDSGPLARKGYLSFEKGETMESTGRKWGPRPLTIPQRTNTGSTSSSLDNISAVDEIVCSPSGFTPMSYVAATGASPNLSRSPNPNASVTTLNSQPVELPAGLDYMDDEVSHYDDDDDSPILGLGIPAKPAMAKMFSYSPFPNSRPNPQGAAALRPPEIIVDNRPESFSERGPKSYWSPDSFHRLALARDSLAPPRSIHTRQSSAASGQTVQIGMRLSDFFSFRRSRASEIGVALSGPPPVQPHPLAFSSTPGDYNEPATMRPRLTPIPSQPGSSRGGSMASWVDVDKRLPPVPSSAPIVRNPPPVASSSMRAQSHLPQATRNSPPSLVPAPLVTRSSTRIPSSLSSQVPSYSSPMMPVNMPPMVPSNTPPQVFVSGSPMIPSSSLKTSSNLSLQVPASNPSKISSNHKRKTSNSSPTLPTRALSIPPPMPNLRLTTGSTGEEVMLLQPTVYQPPKKVKAKKKKTKKAAAAAADGSTPKRKKTKPARKSFRKSVRKTLQRQTASSQQSWI